jgi:hypothetical protein
MILRPSSAHIWINCPGYPTLAATLPAEAPSDPAREGTCAAWVAEMVLTGQAADCMSLVGAQHENGWVIDRAMARHIEGYVAHVRRDGGQVYAERRVTLIPGLVEGTPDAFGVSDDGVLRVKDLKYGFEIVEPSTPQVLIYAAALYIALQGAVAISKIELGIYQPRAYHPSGVYRSRSLTVAELGGEIERIIAAAYATQDPAAMCVSGSHCRRCDAAHKCAAVTHEVYRAVTQMMRAQERHMTAVEMATELDFLDLAESMFKGRRDAVHAEAEARLAKGEHIPGWHIEQGYGQRRWKVNAAMIRMLTGVDPTAGKMVTPAELERLGADPDVVSQITEVPRTKAKLKQLPEGYLAGKFGGTQ